MKTKDKILLGARQYLIKYGQAGFTVRSVANEAGVNQGLVHHYFRSKENLVLELIDSVVEEPFEMAQKLVVGKSKTEIKDIILMILLKNSDLTNLMIEFVYFAQHSPAIKKKIKQVMKDRREFMTNALGIEDEVEKYAFNAWIFGTVFVSRIDDKINIETALLKVFKLFNLIG